MARNTPNPLQFVNGPAANVNNDTPAVAEPVFKTDTKTFAIGDGTTKGGIELAKKTEVVTAQGTADEANAKVWSKREEGDVPTEDAAIQELVSDMPVGATIYFPDVASEGAGVVNELESKIAAAQSTADTAKEKANEANTKVWSKRKEGNVPTEDAAIQELVSDMPVGATIYFPDVESAAARG